jgi:hypothetical protein
MQNISNNKSQKSTEFFDEKVALFAAAMSYDQGITRARHGLDVDMKLLEKNAKILERNVQTDIRDPNWQEVDIE